MRKGPPAGERIGIGRGEVGDRHGEAVVLQQVFDAAGVIDLALSLTLVEVERRRFHATTRADAALAAVVCDVPRRFFVLRRHGQGVVGVGDCEGVVGYGLVAVYYTHLTLP